MEHHPYAFYGMAATSAAFALIVAWMGLRKYLHSFFSLQGLFNDPTKLIRLAKIRKVGLSNNPSGNRGTQKPWLPLPLRRRSQDGWS